MIALYCRWLLAVIIPFFAFIATAQYRPSYSTPSYNNYNTYHNNQVQQQQQASFNRLNQIRQDYQRQQQVNNQANQQTQQRNAYLNQQRLQNSTAVANATLVLGLEAELMQRYVADDTALALIRMFRRKRGSGWPWLAGGVVGGTVLTATSFHNVYDPQLRSSVPQLRIGNLILGTIVYTGGLIGYVVVGQRYNLGRLNEVLIAREQQRPIPLRYLGQLSPRDFNPFAGEAIGR